MSQTNKPGLANVGALIARYASAGILINTVHGRVIIPLGERK
ncbi:MAG: hypothetical protein V3S76_03315 [Candidatus Bipolaricaulota bacterium]